MKSKSIYSPNRLTARMFCSLWRAGRKGKWSNTHSRQNIELWGSWALRRVDSKPMIYMVGCEGGVGRARQRCSQALNNTRILNPNVKLLVSYGRIGAKYNFSAYSWWGTSTRLQEVSRRGRCMKGGIERTIQRVERWKVCCLRRKTKKG